MTDADESNSISTTDRLNRIAAQLQAGERTPVPTVREFLRWFGAKRRGQYIVYGIRAELDQASLVTVPDFEGAYVDAPITFALKPRIVEVSAAFRGTSTLIADLTVIRASDEATVTVGIKDPTYRLSRLAAANKPPVYVAPDRPVVDAVTLMLSNDFSQLPVMTSERTVKGVISWRSIGTRWALDRVGEQVRHFMEDEWAEVPAERSILAALPTIVDHDYVLVRDATGKISGIVTPSDLSYQFQLLAEPFLLLGEIENHVRQLMDGKFTESDLTAGKDPADADRRIKSVADLTFGEYRRVLEEPVRWERLKLPIDRTIFIKELEAVRVIRNDVMHFDPDPLSDDELSTLRRFVKFLQSLQSAGV